jgi:hypothetical protein
MLRATCGDFCRIRDFAPIHDEERFPKESADAARVIAPRDTRAKRELLGGVLVVIARLERCTNFTNPCFTGLGTQIVLRVELSNEGFRFGEFLRWREHAQSLAKRIRGRSNVKCCFK